MQKHVSRLLASISRAVAATVLATTVVGCAGLGGERYPAAPANASAPDYNYIVGPGDTLSIIVWRNPELSLSVPVRPDGQVSTPLIDGLVAQGKTSTQIARDVEKELGKYVRDPVVMLS